MKFRRSLGFWFQGISAQVPGLFLQPCHLLLNVILKSICRVIFRVRVWGFGLENAPKAILFGVALTSSIVLGRDAFPGFEHPIRFEVLQQLISHGFSLCQCARCAWSSCPDWWRCFLGWLLLLLLWLLVMSALLEGL